MNKKRISGAKVEIDYSATKRFFDGRSQREYASPLSATMYQDNEPQLVKERDLAEKQVIGSKLSSFPIHTVFDVGCGIGRWGWFWAEQSPQTQYLGIDFSESLIETATKESEQRGFDNLHFQTMSAVNIEPDKLALVPHYDCIIVSGLLIYLNDADCTSLLGMLKDLLAEKGLLYIREPMALTQRLTLDQFYSEELDADYSAIYRSLSEMQALFDLAFQGELVLLEQAPLFPDRLEKRAQTRQYYTLFHRQA